LLVDVYHEFSDPAPMLIAMKKALKPGGQIVLVEFRAEDESVPIKPEHKMSKKQIMKEMTANGLRLSRSYDKLPWQHMLWFEAGQADAASINSTPVSKP
jgi:ubiquinone/menaquinone biosynthesis C-methylase UbiE